MTTINLTQDPILLLLLSKIIRDASRVSNLDQGLHKTLNELKANYQDPSAVDYESLNSIIVKLGDILSGYSADSMKDDNGSSLAEIIFNFKSKIDELKTKTQLDTKFFSTAELLERIEQFHKRAVEE